MQKWLRPPNTACNRLALHAGFQRLRVRFIVFRGAKVAYRIRQVADAYVRPPHQSIGGLSQMDALEAIRRRRSVREYTGEPIIREDLEKIVDAGRLAATGSNRQPWDFVVVTDREMVERLKVAAQWMEKAGAIIAVVMDPSSRWWLEDGAAAVENILIASTALGYGSCWLEGYTLPHEKEFKELLGVPAEKRLLTLVPIGVPAEWPTIEKKLLEVVLHWERY
jgi:nitroreductase